MQQQDMNSLPGQDALDGEKLRSRPVRPGLTAGRIIVLILLLLILTGIGGYILLPMKLGYTVLHETHTFYVQRHPRLSIYDSAGTITVHKGGPGNTISVTMTTHKGPLTSSPQLDYVFNSAFVDLSVPFEIKDSFGGSTTIDLDITVPQEIDLKLNANEAFISIAGATGKITAITSAGSLDLTHDTLTDDGAISSGRGNITLNGVALAPGSQYTVSTTIGHLSATFARGGMIHVEANASDGTIQSDLPGIAVKDNDRGGQFAHGTIGGNQPAATVTLLTATGVIHLDNGS